MVAMAGGAISFVPASRASREGSSSGGTWPVFGIVIAVIPLDRQNHPAFTERNRSVPGPGVMGVFTGEGKGSVG